MPQIYQEILKNYTKAQRHFNSAEKLHAKRLNDSSLRLLNQAKDSLMSIRDEAILFAIAHDNAEESKELIKTIFNSNGKPEEALSNGDIPINIARTAGNEVVIELLKKIMAINNRVETINQASTVFDRLHQATHLEDKITITRAQMQTDVTAVIESTAATVTAGIR